MRTKRRTAWGVIGTCAAAVALLAAGGAVLVAGPGAQALGSARPALTATGKFADRLPGAAPVRLAADTARR